MHFLPLDPSHHSFPYLQIMPRHAGVPGEIIATYNASFGQHSASAEPIARLLPVSRRSQAAKLKASN